MAIEAILKRARGTERIGQSCVITSVIAYDMYLFQDTTGVISRHLLFRIEILCRTLEDQY